MGAHAERARTGTGVRARMAGVFRTGVMLGVLMVPVTLMMCAGTAVPLVMTSCRSAMMLAVLAMFTMLAMLTALVSVSVMFATSLAMTFAAMGVAVVSMLAMGIPMTAPVMLAVAMLTMTAFMLSISIAVSPGVAVPFAATFVTALALGATAALAAIIVFIVIVFILFFVAAVTVVIAEREQIDVEIAGLSLDRQACIGRRHFARQSPIDGQLEMAQKFGRAEHSPGLALLRRDRHRLRVKR